MSEYLKTAEQLRATLAAFDRNGDYDDLDHTALLGLVYEFRLLATDEPWAERLVDGYLRILSPLPDWMREWVATSVSLVGTAEERERWRGLAQMLREGTERARRIAIGNVLRVLDPELPEPHGFDMAEFGMLHQFMVDRAIERGLADPDEAQ